MMTVTARTTDPHTSHDAAASITDQHRSDLQKLIEHLISVTGGLTDDELRIMLPDEAPSSVRTRRNELVKMGLVHDSGRRALSARGRDQIVWEVVT